EPTEGRILWWSGAFDKLGTRGRSIVFVFQDPTLMPWARVEANVRLPLDLARMSAAQSRRRVADALSRVGLEGFARHYPRQLSGGAVAMWEIACRAFNVPIFLFPKPSDIAAKLASDWPTLLAALGMTLRIALQAFFAAIVIGTLIAFLFVQSRAIEMSFFPYAVLLQVTPIVAIAPLIIILVKNTQVALTVCATVVALFPIISNTTLGLRSVDPGLVNLFRMSRAGRMQTLWRLRIPSA